MIFVKNDIFNPYAREIVSIDEYSTIIDFLQDKFRDGFSKPTEIWLNENKVEVEDYDKKLEDDDIVVLLERPALPIGLIGGWFVTMLANAAISMALSWAVNKLFAPDIPKINQQNTASSIYNLNNSQNVAKLGEVIPVIYGTVRLYPSMICQPYFRNVDNEEYLYHLLCVGQGRYDIEKFMIDSLDMGSSADVEYKLINKENFEDIESFVGDNYYNQLTNTLTTPSNLELGGAWVSGVKGKFSNNKLILDAVMELVAGDKITIEEPLGQAIEDSPFVPTPEAPKNVGAFTVLSSEIVEDETIIYITTTFITESVDIFIYNSYESEKYDVSDKSEYIEVDYSYPGGLFVSKDNGDFAVYEDVMYVQLYDENKELIANELILTQGASNNPIRETIKIRAVRSGVRVSFISFFRRYGKAKSQKMNNTIYINRVKELHKQEDVTDFGDITLLWVKIRATNAISSSGQTQVNGFFKRTDVANDIKSVLTDIYTNINYGGRLPSNDLEFDDTTETVNGAFESVSTVWDALRLVSKAQKYSIYPVGQELQLKYDDKKIASTALFNETNILENSFKVQYSFREENTETDSVECTYRTGEDWNQEAVLYPPEGIYPSKVELFGVTDEVQALKIAKYLFKQERARRKVITFDTDVQGMIPQYLDKIKVSHSALLWGEAGQVYAVNNTHIETSDKVEKSGNITFRRKNGTISNTISYTVVDEYTISVPLLPAWVEEDTFYTIGTVKEYLVTKVTPQGEKVSIEVVNYNERIYE